MKHKQEEKKKRVEKRLEFPKHTEIACSLQTPDKV